MNKFYLLMIAMFVFKIGVTQVKDLSGDSILVENINKTLSAATSMCTVSFVWQATGAVLILTGVKEMETKMGFGLALGIGGVGMATNNAILTDHAYNQIRQLKFTREDSFLRIKMLNNIKTARALSIIQNITPILGVVTGAINWKLSKPDYHDRFYSSSLFWGPAISICAIGMIITIPEVIFIEKTRHDLNTYQQKLTLGTTKDGMGVSYKF